MSKQQKKPEVEPVPENPVTPPASPEIIPPPQKPETEQPLPEITPSINPEIIPLKEPEQKANRKKGNKTLS